MRNAPIERHHLGEIDSTQAEAKRRIDAGDFAPYWITADQQNAGRGRNGHEWVSRSGNYFASLVLPWSEGPVAASHMSFVTALALFNAFEKLGVKDLALKWPNDVLVKGQKIAGILLEHINNHLIIGVGVNIANAPAHEHLAKRALPPIALNSLVETDVNGFHTHFETEILASMNQYLQYGFEPIRNGVSSRLWARADMVYEDGNSSAIVRVFGIDDNGALIIEGDNGRKTVMAGDIFPT